MRFLNRTSVFCAVAGAALVLAAPLMAAVGDTAAFPTVPEANWVGMRLIILPQSRAVQHYGYQELYREDNEFAPLPYAEFAGRVVRVVGIEQGHGPNGETVDEADLQLEDNKKTLHGDIDGGCMDDVAPLSDLETARTLYRGKTLWLASDHFDTYDAAKDVSDSPAALLRHEAFQQIKIKQYSPVRVLEVVPGWYASAPVRFVVQEEGREKASGYVDVHMSDTNIPKDLQALSRFGETFLTSDPRIASAWPAKVWAAIENKEVVVGMTAQQVRMSWGNPKTIISSSPSETDQWLYAPNYSLTLKDGVLSSIAKL